MSKDLVIGVLGGMGTYASIHLFRQYAEVFKAEKEWERPRLIIDNRCTMPSRVRAYLYNENKDLLVEQMTESLSGLVRSGCDKIILACNTSHLFLPAIYERMPELEDHIINIIDTCVDSIVKDNVSEVFLLGTEGTIDSRIYQLALRKYGIICTAPEKDEYPTIRNCIEAVKQNKYTGKTKDEFISLVTGRSRCILGCTELPILYEMYGKDISKTIIYDPIWITLNKIREEYNSD